MTIKKLIIPLVFAIIPFSIANSQSPSGILCDSFEASSACSDGSMCVGDTVVETCASGCLETKTCAGACFKTGPESASCQADLATCDEVLQAVLQLTATKACSEANECQIMLGAGVFPLCAFVVNNSVSQASFDSLSVRSEELGCVWPVPSCLPPPVDVACTDEQCVGVF